MSLSLNDANRLRDAGFIDFEIERFSEGTTPGGQSQPPINLNGAAWSITLNERRKWADNMLQRGWSNEQLNNEILSYYIRGSGTSPWDFLKAEYRPPGKLDYQEAIRNRAKNKISNLYRK